MITNRTPVDFRLCLRVGLSEPQDFQDEPGHQTLAAWQVIYEIVTVETSISF